MNLGYDSDTDALYIDVAAGISAECLEIWEGVVLDFDSSGILAEKDIHKDIHRVSSIPKELKIPERLPSPAGTSSLPDPSYD